MPGFVADLNDETLLCLVKALSESGQAISIYDADDRLRFANKTYQNLFLGDFEGPFTFTEILRYGARNGMGVRIDDNVEALIARTLPRRRSIPRKSFVTDFVDGRWFWMDHTILPNGWVLTVGADITALKHDERSLRQAHDAALLASRTDVLTGLPNRRYILEILDERLRRYKPEGASLCIALIDIDWFKAINDRYGHEVGDAVLQHFASVCRERLSPDVVVGRTGGEEFLILLPSVSLETAVQTIGELRADFPAAVIGECAAELAYTFSAGLTEVLLQDTRTSLLQRADRALYAAKAEGRNCTRVR
ncbi:sensor domain-containing diguanylate cyclase [Microvirga sp. VF16]|uniref:GGDEF domain-containing protein n=1 Tax=Microvirga sp. VF16 TaxID=2807101 RepID=UPI00193E42F5|nr:sensor domain-containing diguanylate cyclase [Microvirga sp. VF16]QRM35464.1 diguanylate cyclase [Microvirga sp. VF16]